MGGIGRGSFRTSEENRATSSGRQNRENSPSGADQNFPAKILFTLAQQQVGAGCKSSGFKDQIPKRKAGVECSEDTLRGLEQHS